MGTKKIKERISPNSVVGITLLNMLGYFFLAAGGYALYSILGGILKELIRSDQFFSDFFSNFPVFIFVGFIAFGFTVLLLFIGLTLTIGPQKNKKELLEFEFNSTTTTAKSIKRGREERHEPDSNPYLDNGGFSYSHWITVQFRPTQARKDIVLRVLVSKKRHDSFVAGEYFKVRYQNSNPCVAVMEWEISRFERTPNLVRIMFHWILVNFIGSMVGFDIGDFFGGGNLLLSSAIAGLIIAEAQWIALYR